MQNFGFGLCAAVRTWAERTPEAIAVTDGHRRFSWRQLAAEVDRLARALQASGVRRGTLVALAAGRSAELVIGALAILRAGGAYVPVDPAYPLERQRLVLDDAACPVLLTERALAASYAAPGRTVLCLDEAHPASAEPARWEPTRPEDLAYVIYTSGSTGRPKGVMVTHHNVARLFESTRPWYGFGPTDVWPLFHSFAFDVSVWEIWGALLHGGRLVIVPHEVTRDPIAFRALVREQGVTVLNQTPSAFRPFLRADALEPQPSADALRLVIFAGEALDFRSLRPWFERHGDERPRLVNMYGITETTVHVTYRRVRAADALEARSLIGVPIPDLGMQLLNPEGRPVADGEVGELWVSGPGVARGYLRRPELDAERFQADPSAPGARRYRSGDLARRCPDGELEYLGRMDQQLKLRGFRIEAGDIESALRALPGVADAAVLLRPQGDDDEPQLVGYVVPRAGAQGPGALDLGALRQALARTLPEHMRPAALVSLPALPLTVNGKLDRRALPAPTRERVGGGVPATALEAELGALVGELLGGGPAGPELHLFESGASSLDAMQLIVRVAERLGVVLPVSAVFRHPTVRALAQQIEQRRALAAPTTPAPREPEEGEWCPLSLLQEQVWVAQALWPESSAWSCPLVLRLRGPLDTERLISAFDQLITRHPALRTVFESRGGHPVQRAASSSTFRLQRTEESTALAQALERPFALAESAGRALLLRAAPDEHILVLVLHHLITDGWSLDRLMGELGRAYAGLPLGPAPASFFAQVLAERRYLDSETGAQDLDFWRATLGDAPACNELPGVLPRPTRLSLRGRLRRFALDRTRLAGPSALARAEGTTLNTALLAVFYALVSRHAAQRDLTLCVPYAGRDEPGLDATQGMVLNPLRVRVRLSPDTTFRQLLTLTRDATQAAYAHGAFPFSRLVDELKLPRDGRPPLAQIAFSPQPGPRAALRLPGIEVEALDVDPGTAAYDLILYLWPSVEGLDLALECSMDLYSEAQVEALVQRYLRLLDAAVATPEAPVAALPMLGEAERALLLGSWSRAERAPGPVETFNETFARQVAARPQAEALREGPRALSYGQLYALAGRLAAQLRAQGVEREHLVALLAERSLEAIVGILGIWLAGGVYLPLDPRLPSQRLSWTLRDASPTLLLLGPGLPPPPEGALPSLPLDLELLSSSPLAPVAQIPRLEDAAYVIYTSGSTGQPKGVVIEHRGLANLRGAIPAYCPLSPGERALQYSSLSFDASVEELVLALAQGGTLVIPQARHALLGPELAELLDAERINKATLVPSVLATLPARPLPALHTLLVAGERCPAALVERWAPGRRMVNGYGPTEASVFSTSHDCAPGEGDPPIGRPLGGATAYVLDEAGQLVPAGVPGELWLGGPGLARGYLNRPELTAARFVDAGALLGRPGRLYRTGDRVRWREDGRLEFLGRLDDQHKIRGFRVETGEIEAALLARDGVGAAAVLVEEPGTPQARLVAYVAPPPEEALELWPSVAEHFVYDELLYLAMSRDEVRNDRYLEALRRVAVGRVVVDLGTGAQAVLARLAVQAGAARVYAVEVLEESYRRAQRVITEAGLDDRITLLRADAATVTLPEPAQVCVSELVGAIGGSEGVAWLLNRARRLLGPDGVMIPQRSLTRIAAVRLPASLLSRPRLGATGAAYARRIFQEVGRPFDLRVCVRGLSRADLVSDVGVFEDLDFRGPIPLEGTHEVVLRLERAGPVSGLLLWLDLFLTDDLHVDILDSQASWLPVFVPLFDEQTELPAGARLVLRIQRTLCDNRRNPDFLLEGELRLPDGGTRPLRHELPHIATTWGGNPFYQRLREGLEREVEALEADRLRRALAEQLPAYLVPAEIVVLRQLPLTPSGKLDRAALPRPEPSPEPPPPAGEAEALVAGIWREVLGRAVDLERNFFDAGGTSLLLVEVQSRLEAALGRRLGLGDLFAHPTIRAMAGLVAGDRSEAGDAQRRAADRAALARARARPAARSR